MPITFAFTSTGIPSLCFTSTEEKELVPALFRIVQGKGTSLVIVNQGGNRKAKRVSILPAAELVPAKRVPVLQFLGPSQNLEEYNFFSRSIPELGKKIKGL